MAESKSSEDILCKYNLPLCCDSVECCDYDPYQSMIAVGHYQLNTDNYNKIGGITLFKYDSSSNDKDKIKQLSFKEMAPILDLKWHSMNQNVYLTAATSNGSMELLTLKNESNNDKFELELKHKIIIPSNDDDNNNEKSPICLSLLE